LLAVTQQTDSM